MELLKGPQGTLFGRNTQGGALNIVSRKPGEEFRGRVRVGYDEFDTYDFQGSISGPLGDGAGFSLAGRYLNSDGFAENVTLGLDQDAYEKLSGRARLVLSPTDSLQFDLSVDATRWDGGLIGGGITDAGLKSANDGDFLTFDNHYRETEEDMVGVSLRIDWDIGNVQLTSITGHRDTESTQFVDFDQSARNLNLQTVEVRQQSTSQELRASSVDAGPWTWSAGVYFFEEDRGIYQEITRGNPLDAVDPFTAFFANIRVGPPPQEYHVNRSGWAAFGQATWEQGNWAVTLGARYSEEDPKFQSYPDVWLMVAPGVEVPLNTAPLANDTAIDIFTPMGSISYKWRQDALVYFTVAQGFKAGGFQDFAANDIAVQPFDNEISTNYELGIKGEFADGRVRVSGDVYYIDITDQQIRYQDFNIGAIPTNRVVNVGKSHAQGLEAEITAVLTPNFIANATAGWVHEAHYDDLDVDPLASPFVGQLEGLRFAMVPEWTWSASGTYTHPLKSGANLVLHGSVSYVGKHLSSAQGTLEDTLSVPDVGSYTRVNVRASFEAERWSATVFAQNLFNEEIIVSSSEASPFLGGMSAHIVEPPRRVGVTLQYNL